MEEAYPLVNPNTGLRFKVPVIGARKPQTRVVKKAAKRSDSDSPTPASMGEAVKNLNLKY